MTAPFTGYPARDLTICPYCLNQLDWSDYGELPLVKETPEGPDVLTRGPDEPETRWRHRTLGAMRQCRGNGEPHLLPADYGDLEPLVIGLVGDTATGKTHLLTAMIAQLERRRSLIARELRIEPLDGRLRQRFYDERVRPFLERHEVLGGTRPGQPEFAYALRVASRQTGRTHAVGFFDVPGEHYRRYSYEDTPFMSVADAVIYVADGSALRSGGGWNSWVPDPGFTHAITQLRQTRADGAGRLPPAVIVVTKSDVLDGLDDDDTVTRWLGRKDESDLDDLRSMLRESVDAGAFLRRHGAELWLDPLESGSQVTIHFASASGVSKPVQDATVFPDEGFGPKRVLRPLLSLFSMTGLLPRIDMDEPDEPPQFY
ncbi:TRAFAC clade GTPase domain-containing protein [Actinomadura formosensis]|uniref:TRAFAC clade GTPase domain-containing protein n=1 Tax=Actinomadura formosensis TaxID=60706 RepID=UPI003D943D41